MVLLLWICCLGLLSVLAQRDPCETRHHSVIDDYRREVNFFTPPGEPYLCDVYMETGWYRFLVNGTDATIPTSCVQPLRCGTHAPVWLDLPVDQYPKPREQKTVRACASWTSQGGKVNCCFYPMTIILRNCGDFYVYRLGSTSACSIAFCAERKKVVCPEGLVFDTTTKECAEVISVSRTCPKGEHYATALEKCVDVVADKPLISTSVDDEGSAYVTCILKRLTSVISAGFAVTWYAVSGDRLKQIKIGPNLKLGADVFAGSSVVCGVQASTESKEILSDPYFLGFKVRESDIRIPEDGQPVNLTFYSTIPIHCSSGTPASQCRLGISLQVFEEGEKLTPTLKFSTCYMEFSAADCIGAVCSEHVVQVTLYPNIAHSPTSRVKKLALIGSIQDFGHGLWRQEVVEVQLELHDLPMAHCHVFSDPHVVTFDGRIYDLHSKGTFVLHKSLIRDFTIHLNISDCGGEGYCACGLTARDSGDVVSVDACQGQVSLGKTAITFPGNYVSEDLRVYQSKGGRMLTIVFASGTLIKAVLDSWVMSLSLVVPAADMNFSRGLCGLYDNNTSNDFHDTDGRVLLGEDDSLIVQAFIQTWKLQAGSNIVDHLSADESHFVASGSRCDCSARNTGQVCPMKPILDDVIPSVAPSKDLTAHYFDVNTVNAEDVDEFEFTNVSRGDGFGGASHEGRTDYGSEIKFPDIEATGLKIRQIDQPFKEGFNDSADYSSPGRKNITFYIRTNQSLSKTSLNPEWPAASDLTEVQASDACAFAVFGSDLALHCTEYMGAKLGVVFDLCKSDLKVKGMRGADFVMPFLEILCDLSVLEAAEKFIDVKGSKPRWPKLVIDAIVCPAGCKNGACESEGCECNPDFFGTACDQQTDMATAVGLTESKTGIAITPSYSALLTTSSILSLTTEISTPATEPSDLKVISATVTTELSVSRTAEVPSLESDSSSVNTLSDTTTTSPSRETNAQIKTSSQSTVIPDLLTNTLKTLRLLSSATLSVKKEFITKPVTSVTTPVTSVATSDTDVSTPVTSVATSVIDVATPVTSVTISVTDVATPVTSVTTSVTDVATPVTSVTTSVPDIASPVTSVTTFGIDVTIPFTNITTSVTDVTIPFINVTTSVTDVTIPFTNVTTSVTNVTIPFTNVTTSVTDVTIPFTNVTTSVTDVAIPFTNVTTSVTDITIPFTNVTTSVTDVTIPFTNVTTSATDFTIPFTNVTTSATDVTTPVSSSVTDVFAPRTSVTASTTIVTTHAFNKTIPASTTVTSFISESEHSETDTSPLLRVSLQTTPATSGTITFLNKTIPLATGTISASPSTTFSSTTGSPPVATETLPVTNEIRSKVTSPVTSEQVSVVKETISSIKVTSPVTIETTPDTRETAPVTTIATHVLSTISEAKSSHPSDRFVSSVTTTGDPDQISPSNLRFIACDVRQERCTDVSFDVAFLAGQLQCRIVAIKIDKWLRTQLPTSRPFYTGISQASTGQFVCVVPYLDFLQKVFATRTPFDSVQVEVVSEVGDVAGTAIYTVYDSLCRNCGRDGRFGCITKPETCYIVGKCYHSETISPYDKCLQCRPEISTDDWSALANNLVPTIKVDERPIVFVGQEVRVQIQATDPEGSRLVFSLNRKDAFISQSGLFLWRSAVSNMTNFVKKNVFIVTARDECDGTSTALLEIVTVPCECRNGGTCSNANQTFQYTCTCPPGYTGYRCEHEVDECASSPCVHGTCVDLINSYGCVCESEYEGAVCNMLTDQCRREPCFPGVLCQPRGGSFVCGSCPPGFTGNGLNCTEIDACQNGPCSLGVTCRDLAPPSDGFDCGPCPRFFVGNGILCNRTTEVACETGACSPLVECEERIEFPGFWCEPCPPGYDGDGSFCDPVCDGGCEVGFVCVQPGLCGCPEGYTGASCKRPVCTPHCRNGGMCIAPNKCRCVSIFTGPSCENTACSVDCRNGGRCIGKNRCFCPYGFIGAFCEVEICQIPCQNNGQCIGPNRCRCQPGFHGQFCQQALCHPPCQNEGKCIAPGRCSCPFGYEGPQCQSALCYPPCLNEGVCRRFNMCKCQPGYVGHRCQRAVCRPSCINSGRCVAPDTCSCNSGWTGHRCDQANCHLPCQNGGICFKPDICVCRKGYKGSDCTQAVCSPPCENEGRCVAPGVCRCRTGFTGERCGKPRRLNSQ